MQSLPTGATVAVIGGGPAGLMAAEQIATAGARVTVYDRMPSVGRKFLMAGRGGLNLTHSEPFDSFIARYGDAAECLRPVLTEFSSDALIDWCTSLGIETFIGSSGRIFPKELKASPLLRAWLRRLNKLGVTFALRHDWKGWDETGALIFTDEKGEEKKITADATILALGGASWPRLGATGDWADLLKTQGISIAPLRPANCGFVAPWSSIFAEKFAGTPLKPITLSFAGRSVQGEAMISREGLEGSVIYAFSAAIRDAIAANGEAVLSLDLRPGLSQEALIEKLNTPRGSQSSATYLRKMAGLSPVALGLMRESLGGASLPIDPATLAARIKATKIRLTAPTSLTRAISTAGGICRDELDAHFMLKKKPGVFAIGEMLDWEAPTGGYLLQACFSMAVMAAEGVASFCGRGA